MLVLMAEGGEGAGNTARHALAYGNNDFVGGVLRLCFNLNWLCPFHNLLHCGVDELVE